MAARRAWRSARKRSSAISTAAGRCTDVYDLFTGEYMTTICDCTASTGFCGVAFPHGFGG